MASVAGNKRRHKENTIEVKYAALKELERGVSNKDVSEKFNIPKNTLSTWKKNKDKIIAAFKSSGGTKRQRIKEKLTNMLIWLATSGYYYKDQRTFQLMV